MTVCKFPLRYFPSIFTFKSFREDRSISQRKILTVFLRQDRFKNNRHSQHVAFRSVPLRAHTRRMCKRLHNRVHSCAALQQHPVHPQKQKRPATCDDAAPYRTEARFKSNGDPYGSTAQGMPYPPAAPSPSGHPHPRHPPRTLTPKGGRTLLVGVYASGRPAIGSSRFGKSNCPP